MFADEACAKKHLRFCQYREEKSREELDAQPARGSKCKKNSSFKRADGKCGCPHCGRVFGTGRGLSGHMNKHGKRGKGEQTETPVGSSPDSSGGGNEQAKNAHT